MGAPPNDLELIRLVEAYPILYDKNLARGQKNAAMKDKAWRDLSLRLNASERACITRWKSIRDRFGKEFRRVQENPNECINWDMFEHLLFLRDHYKHGCANDALLTVRIDPKKRKRGRKRRDGGEISQAEEDESQNEDEMGVDNLLLNQQLIALVKDHPVLYDKFKIRDSKNLTAKNEAWREISEGLGISEEICYKRWKKLRDRFAREYRAQKLDAERPMTWIYFQDLIFLEAHYRKGVPLPVEEIKRKSVENNENYWGDEYPIECLKEEESVGEQIQEFADMRTQSLDELIILPTKRTEQKTDVSSSMTVPMAGVDAPEAKLSNVISSIEQVLQQSQDCLKSLQQQNEEVRMQLASKTLNGPVDMLQKVHILLDGLSEEHRQLAERRILQFLCECQIKVLNNEMIDDVCDAGNY